MRKSKRAAKKTVPAKNSEANFWRPRFTRPLRAGKRANANFACSEGFFLSGAPRRLPGLAASCAACRCLACWLLCSVFRRFFCRCSAALFPACGLSAVFCLACAACLPFGRRRLCFRLAGSLPLLCKLLRPLPCLPAVRFVCAFSSCFGCLFARSVLCARLFSLIFRPFLPGFLPLKSLFICRSGRDGNFLACPLPRLCSRPAGLVICCFFAGFCAHCLFACSALFMRVFSLLCFCTFSCLTSFLSKLFSFVAQAATGISLLVPSRGFVPGLRAVLSPAAFSRTFAPVCLACAAAACHALVCAQLSSCFGCLFACSALFMRVFSLLFFALSCLTSSSQISFHLSLRPRRASTFFRKESRQRFAKGLRPFEPHSCALRPFFPLFRAAGRLTRPFGRKPPAGRETLEKPRSRAQLFKRFCAKGDACALWLISPFPRAAGRLSGPSGRKPPADRGNARKAKGAKLQLFGRFCAWGMRRGFRPALGKTVSSARARTRKQLRACAAG